jgi:hypothetical protein
MVSSGKPCTGWCNVTVQSWKGSWSFTCLNVEADSLTAVSTRIKDKGWPDFGSLNF